MKKNMSGNKTKKTKKLVQSEKKDKIKGRKRKSRRR